MDGSHGGRCLISSRSIANWASIDPVRANRFLERIMSLSNDRLTAARIQKEVADLQRKQGDEAKKVADSTKKMNGALASANRATNSSTAKSYLGTAERESKNVEAAQDKQARISSDIARKMGDLARAQESVRNGEAKERKNQAVAYEKQRREQAKTYEKQRESDARAIKALQLNNDRLSRDITSLAAQMTAAIDRQASQAAPFAVENADGSNQPYDFFISHAWKDKSEFVDGLALKAEDAGLSVWYDRQALRWGDSIRQKIDEGLRKSFFGVVVLSPNFFERPWPQIELDAIVQKDLSGRGRLLPIWHKLTQDEVANHAPTLAGRLALSTSNYSTNAIVEELVSMRDTFRAAAGLNC